MSQRRTKGRIPSPGRQGHTAPPSLRQSIEDADRHGRALVTVIERRLTIVLPLSVFDNMTDRPEDIERNADRFAAVARALESEGISTDVLGEN